MDTDKKRDEKAEELKQGIGNAIGDLIKSSTTLLAHSAEASWDGSKNLLRKGLR